jgi:hypothetical protein
MFPKPPDPPRQVLPRIAARRLEITPYHPLLRLLQLQVRKPLQNIPHMRLTFRFRPTLRADKPSVPRRKSSRLSKLSSRSSCKVMIISQ